MGRVRAYVVVAPGLEDVAVGELRDIGITGRLWPSRGGIGADLTTRQLYAVHRWSSVATRVLVRVAAGSVRTFEQLQELTASVAWDAYLRPGDPVDVHAACRGSKLYHEGAVTERVVGALGRPVDPSAQRVQVRIDHDTATISVDASGASLHHRGWRSAGHAASLRPTIAAAMLRAAGYDGSIPLVDPMTGSGTIAVEAAVAAARLPQQRDFAFQRWPSFEAGTWASVTAPAAPVGAPAPVLAADRDAGAVATTQAHVAAAGVGDIVRVEHAALSVQSWPDRPSLVVCNPPYGHRIGDRDDLRDLYATLGRRVADGGHTLCLLVADDLLARATGLRLDERFVTSNGGIRVQCRVGR